MQRLHDLEDTDLVDVPWAHLLRDADCTCVWREAETSWVGVGDGHPSGVPPAPVLLMAHPCAAILAGSGDAIAWLESWRSQERHAETLRAGNLKRRRAQPSLKQVPELGESPRKKPRVSTSGANVVGPRKVEEARLVREPSQSPCKKPPLTTSNARRFPADSDDEPVFVEGSSSGTPCKRKWKTLIDINGREVIDLTE